MEGEDDQIIYSFEDYDIVVDDDGVEENVIELGNCVGVDEDVVSEECEIVPKVGMKFTSVEETFEFYKAYAYKVGFPVKKRTSKKSHDGLLRYVVFACCREGKRTSTTSSSLKPRPTIQMGCEAKLAITIDALGTWRVTNVHLEHNHDTSPSKSRLYRCNRQLSDHVKKKLEVNDIAGISLHKSFNSTVVTVVEACGYEHLTFVEKDCRNYIDKVRRLRLGEGDAEAIQSYFLKMQSQCPGFFFCVDLDEESRLRNVFWADNRCRQAYKEFGGVVTFDTTYLTNRYDMPFAPFVGVNHHGQSMLMGCGLLSNEDTHTFVWLFRTWLQCMEDVHPMGIITDQDRAMQNAIEIVFPNTKHRWCLWHIMKKLPEKFGYHTDKGSILWDVHELVYDSQRPDEFERGWHQMLDTYSLHENEWLSGLYRERTRWVPCFLRSSFWVGMSTTQRSESMNAFFDGYVHSKTSLKQFVEQYERALRSKVEKEFLADFKSYSQMVPCATRFSMEKQFQEVYTLSKFQEFQEELTGKVYCDVISAEDVCSGTTYKVEEEIISNQVDKRKTFTVFFNKEKSLIECSCHLFEFRGIVCRHSLCILIRNRVKLLPQCYILRRWRRDVPRAYTRMKINYDGWVNTVEQDRYEQLCRTFAILANKVVDDEVRHRELMEWLEKQLQDETPQTLLQNKVVDDEVPHHDLTEGCREVEKSSKRPILDPICSKRKGAPKKLRKKGPLETTTKRAKVRSKGKKEHVPMEKHSQESQPLTPALQDPQYPMLTPVSYSQQLMETHYQHWNAPYRFNWVLTYSVGPPLKPMIRPEDNENDVAT